jgi:lipopolysaccharide transport system ATP-binding protein
MRAIAKSGATVIFVSHNLHAVAEFCQRAILLDHGRVAADGSTDSVVRKYLDTASGVAERRTDTPVRISRVGIRGESGEMSRFRSGQSATIEVDLEAVAPSANVAVVLEVKNADFYEVFNTSSERLGTASLSLEGGERARCVFNVQLNLGPGTYYLGIYLYRYDLEKEYDHVFPASSFVIASDVDSRGSCHLKPRVASFKRMDSPNSTQVMSLGDIGERRTV